MTNEDELLEIQVEPDGFVDSPQPGHPFADLVVLLSLSVVQQIKEHTETHLNHEMGGMLIGNIWEQNGSTYADIKESLPSKIEGTYANLSFTVETWIDLERQREELFPQYKKIGWYHSHLGYGIFLSSLDVFLHECAFSLPWHVALVYDPILSRYGVFRWLDGEIVPTRFYINSEKETIQEAIMSETIGHQLRVLSNHLEELPVSNAITTAIWHIESRLHHTIADTFTSLSPVEDILTTIIEIADIDGTALQQARKVLKDILGQQLILNQNAYLASPAIFEGDKLVVTRQHIYFLEENNLYWFPLYQEAELSVIFIPTPICDITANNGCVFALDKSGIIYTFPLSTMQGFSAGEKAGSSTNFKLKTLTLTTRSQEPFQTITAHDHTLYLSTRNKVWIVQLGDDFDYRSHIVFNLSSVKSVFPIEVSALAVDQQENIYIIDVSNSRVLQMQSDGRIELAFVGDRRQSLIHPLSLCISNNELFVLDIFIRQIMVYNLENKRYARHYTWGEFVGKKAIQRLYTDETGRVYFSAGKTLHRLYYLDDHPIS